MEFGPEIKVDGVKPEWLKDGDVWQWRLALDPHFEDGIAPSKYEQARTFGLIEAIRLPANDPRYNPTPTPDERAVAPELVARLVELARSVATSPACTIFQTVEAQNILAALEPVDADLVIARQMAAEEACKHHDHYVIVPTKDGVGQRVWGASAAAMILDGQADDSPAVSGRRAALARGRQLEKEGK